MRRISTIRVIQREFSSPTIRRRKGLPRSSVAEVEVEVEEGEVVITGVVTTEGVATEGEVDGDGEVDGMAPDGDMTEGRSTCSMKMTTSRGSAERNRSRWM
jgi:hypothetical protein